MRKNIAQLLAGLLAASVGLAIGTAGMRPALANSGPHTQTIRFYDQGAYSGARWIAGTHEYHFSTWFQNRGAWRSRIQDAFAEIDTISSFNIHIEWSGVVADTQLSVHSQCDAIDTGFYSYISAWNGGENGPLAQTTTCDRDGDNKLDFFAMWINKDHADVINALDADNINEYELQAMATHEGFHALGFIGHWGEDLVPGAGLCYSSQAPTWDLMCPLQHVMYDYVWEDLDATDEHNGVWEFREGYPV